VRFFTSDTHYFHEKILVWRNEVREAKGLPIWRTMQHMHEHMIENHNSVVGVDDEFIHLGDVTFKPSEKRDEFLYLWERLNGKKTILNPGNHDSMKWMVEAGLFKEFELWSVWNGFFTSHIPLPHIEFRRTPWQVHGHTHQLDMGSVHSPYICVCVEATDFTPVSQDQIKAEIARRERAGYKGVSKYLKGGK
jgi:calcineurin-like phosphoesterase family protein